MAARSGSAGGTEAAMAEVLKSVGAESFEPRLLAALAECAKRYTAEVLADAKDYAAHRNFNGVGAEDVKLALQTHPSTHSQTWRQAIRDLAADVNRQDLPPIPDLAGIREPVVAHNFETRAHTLLSGSEVYASQTGVDVQVPMAMSGESQTQSSMGSAPMHVSASSHSATSASASGSAAAPTEDDQPNKRFRMEFSK